MGGSSLDAAHFHKEAEKIALTSINKKRDEANLECANALPRKEAMKREKMAAVMAQKAKAQPQEFTTEQVDAVAALFQKFIVRSITTNPEWPQV